MVKPACARQFFKHDQWGIAKPGCHNHSQQHDQWQHRHRIGRRWRHSQFLEATATSGLPVSFAVTSGPGVITEGNTLSFVGDGTVEITATQEGDLLWSAATPVITL